MTALDPVVEAVVRRLEDKIDHAQETTALQLVSMGEKVEGSKSHAEQLVLVITSDLKHVQSVVSDVKVGQEMLRSEFSTRLADATSQIAARLDEHVSSPNPHPHQEQWLRQRHDVLAGSVDEIREELSHLRGERAGRAPYTSLVLGIAGTVIAGVLLAVLVLVFDLNP